MIRDSKIEGLPGVSAQHLPWDSDFFKADMAKVLYAGGQPTHTQDFVHCIRSATGSVYQRFNVFAEVPSEAIGAMQTLQSNGFRLIETRLNYYHTLADIPSGLKKARVATNADIPALKMVASGAVNAFDKYHADPFFTEAEANTYLETYVSNCVNGFAEAVFVPDLPPQPASFAAISRLNEPGWKAAGPVFRIPLTACLPENSGWHFPLCGAALEHARNQGGSCLIMTTQSTNRAVVHNCEKLGFKLGSTTHLFSISSK